MTETATFVEFLAVVSMVRSPHPAEWRSQSSSSIFVPMPVPLSPSRIICYRSRGSDALWLGR